jgi:hypothetical protein
MGCFDSVDASLREASTALSMTRVGEPRATVSLTEVAGSGCRARHDKGIEVCLRDAPVRSAAEF